MLGEKTLRRAHRHPIDQHAEEGVERQLGAGGDAGDQQGDDEKAANRPQEMPEECRRRRRRTTDLRGGERVEEARSEEHTSELQSLMRISYAVFCLKKKN